MCLQVNLRELNPTFLKHCMHIQRHRRPSPKETYIEEIETALSNLTPPSHSKGIISILERSLSFELLALLALEFPNCNTVAEYSDVSLRTINAQCMLFNLLVLLALEFSKDNKFILSVPNFIFRTVHTPVDMVLFTRVYMCYASLGIKFFGKGFCLLKTSQLKTSFLVGGGGEVFLVWGF